MRVRSLIGTPRCKQIYKTLVRSQDLWGVMTKLAENSQTKLLLIIMVTFVAAAVIALTVGTAKAAPGAGTGASFVVECGINGVFELDPIAFSHHQHVESGSELFNKPGI